MAWGNDNDLILLIYLATPGKGAGTIDAYVHIKEGKEDCGDLHMSCIHTTVYVNDGHRNNAMSIHPFGNVMHNGYNVEANFSLHSLYFLFLQ